MGRRLKPVALSHDSGRAEREAVAHVSVCAAAPRVHSRALACRTARLRGYNLHQVCKGKTCVLEGEANVPLGFTGTTYPLTDRER